VSLQPPPPGAYVPPVYQPGPAPGIRYSGFLARFFAYVIDGFLVGIVVGVPSAFGITLLAVSIDGQRSSMALVGFIVVLLASLVGIAYKPWMWSHGGQTIGYKLMNLRVVRERDGGPISGGQAVGRLLGYIISGIFYLGYIWILFDARRQGWHDKLASTVVIEV
jgi:uncharacterized RDD family membrane protein YckC